MKGYQLETELSCFQGGIQCFEAQRDSNNAKALVLCFPRSDSVDTAIYKDAAKVVEQLRAIDKLLPLLETDISSSSECKFSFCVSYEWGHSFKPLAKVEQRGLWVMRNAVEILNDLELKRLVGEFLGEQMIFVDEKNFSIQLGFIGLAKVFRAYSAEEQTKPAGRGDDVYNLARCFGDEISKSSSEVIRSCLAEDNTKRPGYHPELLRDIKKDISFRPDYTDEVSLLFPDKNSEATEKLIDHLNLHDCHISPWEENEKKGKTRRECKFQTTEFEGTFINTKGDLHFYVPGFNKLSKRSDPALMLEILRVKFTKTEDSVRNNKREGYHHLVACRTEKDEVIQKWLRVPKAEEEFIKETAFHARYRHVRKVGARVKKFAFLLQDDAMNWQNVENLKQKQKQLEAVPMIVQAHSNHFNVGIVDDITTGRLIVGVESNRDDIPRSGKLQINDNDRLRIPFDFHYRKDKKVFFFACDIDDAKDLCERLKKRAPVDVSIVGQNGVFGDITGGEILILPEIITRDPETGYRDDIFGDDGELREDIHSEIIPFIRQIDAIDQFAQGDIWEPLLCGILATPSEHKPIIVPSTELEWSKKNLDDRQKDAVRFALHQKPIFLIQGPPGTGKTTVIVEIVHQILAANRRARILVCSQTNTAVDNVLERLPDKLYGIIRKVRLVGKAATDKISKRVKPFLYDKVLGKWAKDVSTRSKQVAGLDQKPNTIMAHALEDRANKQMNINPAQKNRIQDVLKKWHAFLLDLENEDCQIRGYVEGGWLPLKTAFLKSRNVIGSTCVHIASSRYREIFRDAYDCVLIDEASKATPAETMIPIVRAKQVILIGDHKQLPPFVTSEKGVWKKIQGEHGELEDQGIDDLRRQFGVSLFEELVSEFSRQKQLQSCQIMLNVQRRMSEQIGDLISKHFYEVGSNNKLNTPDDKKYKQDKRLDLPFKQETSLIFIDTSGRKDCHDNGSARWRENQCNADVVTEILQCLSQRLKEKLKEKPDVAVIAGYRGQVDLLKKKIRQEPTLKNLAIPVSTVDAFQGREHAIVIYDVVRSSESNDSIGFLDDPRRLNVALSRAQKLLIIIGDAGFLINRARPDEKREAEKPILGEIAEEIQEQGYMFKSLNEALK